MAELFGVDVRTVSEHLKSIFASQELAAEAVIRKFRITASDGKNYQTQFYNLNATLSPLLRVILHPHKLLNTLLLFWLVALFVLQVNAQSAVWLNAATGKAKNGG